MHPLYSPESIERGADRLSRRIDPRGLYQCHCFFSATPPYHKNRDPVTTCDGHSYDRLAIEAWLARGHKRSPMTGSELQTRRLYPNVALKQLAAHLIPMTQEEEVRGRD